MQYAFVKRSLAAVMMLIAMLASMGVKAGFFGWLPGASYWIMLACVFGTIAFEVTKKPKKS